MTISVLIKHDSLTVDEKLWITTLDSKGNHVNGYTFVLKPDETHMFTVHSGQQLLVREEPIG